MDLEILQHGTKVNMLVENKFKILINAFNAFSDIQNIRLNVKTINIC